MSSRHYEPLEVEENGAIPSTPIWNGRRSWLGAGRRRLLIILGGIVAFFVIINYFFGHHAKKFIESKWHSGMLPEDTGIRNSHVAVEDTGIRNSHVAVTDYNHGGDIKHPPTWAKMDVYEADLPQHNLSLPYPEGKTGRYVFFHNQIRLLGWNNVFNEILMNTHLAYESKRAYVFIDYYWKEEYYHWPKETYVVRFPRTPLNALISGPSAGGPWERGDPAPRSVHELYWNKACPENERRRINTREIKPALSESQGSEVFAAWKKVLLEAPERCIEIMSADEDSFPQTFDLWLWGSDRILSLWDSFSKSPTSRLLGPSPLIESALQKNLYIFRPKGAPYIPGDPFERTMAMHIRRGDFKDACNALAQGSTYYSWNLLPGLPDAFDPPRPLGTPESIAAYMEHCLPPSESVVKKAREAREDFLKSPSNRDKPLDVMYLMTNDQSKWIDDLKEALMKDGWHTIRTTRDLELDQVQLDIDMRLDAEFGARAAVFVGNGWSSFTSNIVHQRLVQGKEYITCRFW